MITRKLAEERIVELLLSDHLEKEIPSILKSEGIKPCSLSSVEKILNSLKKRYKVTTMFSLGIVLYKKKIQQL